MKVALRRTALAALATLGLAVGVSGTAWADSGSYTSTHTCSGMGVQAHYITETGNARKREDGMSGYTGGNGYVRRVLIKEQDETLQYGSRDISYSGSSTSVSFTGVSTSYLPWMTNYSDHTMIITASLWTSTGANCAYAWSIN